MWIKVREADLISTLALDEVDAFRRSADFESDPIDNQIRRTCSHVRGCIRTGGALKESQMHPEADWLPESLVSPAMDFLRYQILTRMDRTVNESRTKAYDRACQIFDDLRRGDFVPEPNGPTVEGTEKAVSPAAAEATPERLLD